VRTLENVSSSAHAIALVAAMAGDLPRNTDIEVT
jgi:hypothetical protein